ncbi:MAG: hypothetical protein ACLR4Z_06460 [Butyricicoccaceae bacterium]
MSRSGRTKQQHESNENTHTRSISGTDPVGPAARPSAGAADHHARRSSTFAVQYRRPHLHRAHPARGQARADRHGRYLPVITLISAFAALIGHAAAPRGSMRARCGGARPR